MTALGWILLGLMLGTPLACVAVLTVRAWRRRRRAVRLSPLWCKADEREWLGDVAKRSPAAERWKPPPRRRG